MVLMSRHRLKVLGRKVGKPKGYLKYTPSFIETFLTNELQSTNKIVEKAKKSEPDIHWHTVIKLLRILERDGKVKMRRISSYYLWTKPNSKDPLV